ncbi:g6956 [Coccomyxa viridis]|uniref:G6956 protein n=1 Tax=Coccomyxa viridis TaxID=1274662 RepID=A0ABP1FWL0_9CHLO
MFGVAGVLDWLLVHQRVLGGRQIKDIHTFAPKHKEAERERFLNMDREGCPDSPVIMNPLRHNIPAHIRNAEDLKALGEF